jgi:LysM repeat protein
VKNGDSLWSIASHKGMSVSELKSLNGLKSNTIYPGQVLKISGTAAAETQTASTESSSPDHSSASSSASTSATTYTVNSGDSLWKIASKNGITVSALKSANGLKSDVIYPGQTLRLSGSASSSSAAVTQTSYKSKSEKTSSHSASSYKVKKGDSLWEIATLHGVTVNQLMRTNNLSSTLIYPGQQLDIPGSFV